MDERGQGSFEYILLLAGVLLIVVLIIIMLHNISLAQAGAQINNTLSVWAKQTNASNI